MAKSKNDDEPRVKCSWSDPDDALLVRTMRECKEIGFQSDSGWKPQTWPKCAEALKDSPGPEKTATKIRDHYGTLKAAYVAVKKLREQSGFGWDAGLKLVTATDDVWDRYLEHHKKAATWRKTPFPLYDDMQYLVDGTVATGAGAFHAGFQIAGQSIPLGNLQGEGSSQDDSEVGNISNDTLINDDLTPSSPAIVSTPSSRKRAASSSPNEAARRRKRNADAAMEIAGALRGVAASLTVVGSPEIRRRAIKQMEDDDEFSSGEEVDVMRLFTKDISVAQTYIASSKKRRRTAYVRSILEVTEI